MNLYSYADEDNERYELLKKYFTIPYVPQKLEFKLPRKSLEEIRQELDEKFDKLIEKTHLEYRIGHDWLYKKRRYEDFCKKQDEDFEYARENLAFPQKLTLSKTGLYYSNKLLVSGGAHNVVTWTTSIGNGNAGYWSIQPSFRVYLDKKPSAIVRYFSKRLLNFTWIDEK